MPWTELFSLLYLILIVAPGDGSKRSTELSQVQRVEIFPQLWENPQVLQKSHKLDWKKEDIQMKGRSGMGARKSEERS